MSGRSVLVVGGGIGGMCAAYCLARAGEEVSLVERDPDWRALGAGLTLNGATLRAFGRIGLLDSLRRIAYCSDSRQIRNGKGELVLEANAPGTFGAGVPNMGGILRPELHRFLQAAVASVGVRARLGIAVTSCETRGEQVRALFSDGTQGDYDYVIGADGIASALRQQMFPRFAGPQYTGQGCWRAVLPRPPEVIGPVMFFGRLMAGINPVSESHLYLFLLQNMPEKTWIEPGEWLERLRQELADFGGVVASLREQLGEDSQINYRPLEALVLDAPWHCGRVLLIGDAAHATTPHSGFGAGLAVEDACLLGELAAGGLDVVPLFEAFMARRYDRCASIVRGTIGLGALEIRHAPPEEFAAATRQLHAAIQQLP
jgi:2-polyprenyl-6-methoxyphenol hydroxylase-like FAD-dependent oxidoreductase